MTIERAETNVAVDDSVFRFPPAGTPIVRTILPGPASLHASSPAAAPAPAASRAPVFDSAVVSGLGIRNIGSATMSGRVSSIAARTSDGKTTVFVGAASGGVWKSQDGGTTFHPVFDKMPVQSIGSIAIDPTNPRTVWVGTGES